MTNFSRCRREKLPRMHDKDQMRYIPLAPVRVFFVRFLRTPPPLFDWRAFFKRIISSWNSLNSASFGSSLIFGLFLMFFARFAYLQTIETCIRQQRHILCSTEISFKQQSFALDTNLRYIRQHRELTNKQHKSSIPPRKSIFYVSAIF